MSFQVRLLLTFVLCGAILLAFQRLRPEPTPAAMDATVAAEAAGEGAGQEADAGAPKAAATSEPPAPAPLPPADADVEIASRRLATELLAAMVTNRSPGDGGLVESVELLSSQFAGHETASDPLQLGGARTLELSFVDDGGAFYLPRNVPFVMEESTPRRASMVHRGAGATVRVSLELVKGYQGKLVVEVENTGAAPLEHALRLRARIGNGDSRYDVRRGLCRTREDLEDATGSDVEDDGPAVFRTPTHWGAADGKYFGTIIVGQEPFAACEVDVEAEGARIVTSLTTARTQVAPGSRSTQVFGVFLGAKELERLQAFAAIPYDGPSLEETIDWGYLGAISEKLGKVLLALLRWVHGLVPSWGASILLLTVLVKLLTLPLTLKQMASMKRMKDIQPEIAKIKEKYADDRTRQGQEMQALFSRSGVNPLAGCLPMLIQLPVWFALYSMLLTVVELVHEPFLWLPDLTQQDPFYILPLSIGAAMVLQNRMMPNTMDEAQAKMMRWFMPIMFTGVMLFLPSGLGLYILTNIVLSVIQSYVQLRARKDEPAPAT